MPCRALSGGARRLHQRARCACRPCCFSFAPRRAAPPARPTIRGAATARAMAGPPSAASTSCSPSRICDVCTAADKTLLQERSPITAKLVALIDGAQTSIDIANYTFSVRAIEEAILRAKPRGVTIRVAMDKGQEIADTVATRLAAAGVDGALHRGWRQPGGPAAREVHARRQAHARDRQQQLVVDRHVDQRGEHDRDRVARRRSAARRLRVPLHGDLGQAARPTPARARTPRSRSRRAASRSR